MAVLCGSEVPLLLRRYGERYLLVGECFVMGLMDGDIMDDLGSGKASLQTFAIA